MKFKLDDVDHKILDLLIDNSRMPFTDIAKKLLISAGTVHVRVKKMEDAGIIKGSSLALDYKKLGYTFIAYIGIFLEKTHLTNVVLEKLDSIPFVTVAHITTGRFNIFCKVRSRNTNHAKEIIFMIDDIDGVSRTETMISLEESIKKLSDSELKVRTEELRKISKESKDLDKLLPEAFALVREAGQRTIGQRHYDVQLMGGIILHQGKISEMKTGEGKTLVATLAAFLNALSGKGVHIITVNDYLAKRDAEWMGQIYKFLGLSVGCLTSDVSDENRKQTYQCDIVYGTNNEFAFDYLRDNMRLSLDEMVQRDFNYCIVDEVDSILIDEARTPLIISGPTEDTSTEYFLCNKIVNDLNSDLYQKDEKDRNVTLNDKGVDEVEKKLSKLNLLNGDNFYDPRNISLVHHINQSLKANILFQKDKDYIIRDNQVQIIDEFTGRVLEGRRYSDGLHQAIEAKEGVPIQNENQTFASTTYQNYFRLYQKLSGMTGTAMTEANEFYDIYKLDVVEIPTNVSIARKDLNDQIYRT